MRNLIALLVAFMVAALPGWAASDTTKLKNNLNITGNLVVNGTSTVTGATTQTGNFTAAGTVTGADLAATDDLTVGDDATITGDLTLTVPLTRANANNSIARKVFVVPIGPGGTIADGATYTATIPVFRAGTVTGIKASIGTAVVGGTSTVTISKNGSQTLLSTANVDPTTFAANTATTLTLTATGADLAFAAGDVIKVVHVAGTQTTDGVGEAIAVEFATTDY